VTGCPEPSACSNLVAKYCRFGSPVSASCNSWWLNRARSSDSSVVSAPTSVSRASVSRIAFPAMVFSVRHRPSCCSITARLADSARPDTNPPSSRPTRSCKRSSRRISWSDSMTVVSTSTVLARLALPTQFSSTRRTPTAAAASTSTGSAATASKSDPTSLSIACSTSACEYGT
jgi:hypothetical protein